MTNLPKRYKYAAMVLGTVATYTGYHRHMAPTFEDKIRLVFPDFAAASGKRVVKILSQNQLQYLLKTCAEEGKTVSPLSEGKSLPADVYFDNRGLSKIIKVSEKDGYVKVESGVKLIDLSNQLASTSYQVPLTYPVQVAAKEEEPSIELAIQENLLCL